MIPIKCRHKKQGYYYINSKINCYYPLLYVMCCAVYLIWTNRKMCVYLEGGHAEPFGYNNITSNNHDTVSPHGYFSAVIFKYGQAVNLCCLLYYYLDYL